MSAPEISEKLCPHISRLCPHSNNNKIALRELKSQGASILMVEQNFAVAKALGDQVAVMEDGCIIWTGAMADLAADAALQERLMGLSMEVEA